MYLKSIEIQGFKSFPDKIKLDFTKGITSIIGPNGSGKSNISDAIRWVMGEQSAKSLRGSKMEDIIFAGTETRAQVGFAQVSLLLDNSTGLFPIEYNEVLVTRRLYRSGESEFYINKSSCRLKDIHQLFLDTGLGKDGYSIFSQGNIDEILSAKAEDRRLVFEEAAGIAKYRYRKNEAERKLKLTHENLIRINDIIGELSTQLEPLKIQSETAKKFLEKRQELQTLDINLSIHIIDNNNEELKKIDDKYNILNNEIQSIQLEINNLEKVIEKDEELYNNKLVVLEENKHTLHEKEKTINQLNNDIQMLDNNIRNYKDNITNIQKDIEVVDNRIIELKKQIDVNNINIKNTKNKKEKLTIELENFENASRSIEDSLQNSAAEIDSKKADLIELMNKISSNNEKIKNFNMLKKSFIERRNKIIFEKNDNNRQISSLKEELIILDNSIQKENNNIKELAQKNNQMTIEVNKKSEETEKIKNLLHENIVSVKEKESKRNLLIQMENSLEGFSKSVKAIINAKNRHLSSISIYGTLADIVDVPTEFSLAMDAALGHALQNIIVENEKDAKECIAFLKKNRKGRATFLPVSNIKGKKTRNENFNRYKGYIGIASEIIRHDPKFEDIINMLLGKVLIVDTIDNAVNMFKGLQYKLRIVTLDGEIVSPSGAMTGGSLSKNVGILSRKSEIKILSNEISSIKKSVKELNLDIENNQKQIQHIKSDIQVITNNIEKVKTDLEKSNKQKERNEFLKEQLQTSLKSLEDEEMQINEELSGLDNEIATINTDINEKNQFIALLEKEVNDREDVYSNIFQDKNKITDNIINLKMKLSDCEKDIQLINEKITNINDEIKRQYIQKDEKLQATKKLEQIIIETSKSIEDKKQTILNHNNIMETLKGKTTKLSEEYNNLAKMIKDNQKYIKEKNKDILKLKDDFVKIENKKLRIELDVENLINKLWEDYNKTYSNALEFKQEILNITSTKKTIERLKSEIKNMGIVNVNAIEEYKNVKERFDFLTEQQNDLKESEITLKKIINDMVNIMNKEFMTQFKKINSHFNMVFNELFSGGKAELRLTDKENVLQSGVEIIVQPPGKKLQNLLQLSGGEKAFTAIALFFSMLKVRPTPFCILDEIDAALDDVNVSRFAEYLYNFTGQTQFILVTHRRGTMEKSDSIYGVTMQEKGVSKLLELDFNEVAAS